MLKAKEGCCEEASHLSTTAYIPCNRPATKIMHSEKDQRNYRMCDMCADHNLRRGMTEVTPSPKPNK
jgi:hypothetical protein